MLKNDEANLLVGVAYRTRILSKNSIRCMEVERRLNSSPPKFPTSSHALSHPPTHCQNQKETDGDCQQEMLHYWEFILSLMLGDSIDTVT